MEIKRKPVAFNIEDPDQKALLDHACQRTNFSAYIKRLIQRDMEGGYSFQVMNQTNSEVDENLMEGLV